MPKGKFISYSAAEMAWLEANRAMVISDYHRAFIAEFGREDVSAGHLHALRKRKGWKTGRTGHFAKGQEPMNKGKKCAPGTGGLHPNARRTQFKKGERQGVAVKLYKPVGAERLSKSGYRERKIHDGMPLQSRWRAVHLIEWEAANGPIPEGYCLKCLGDKLNTDPSNWELIPRALLPRLAGGNRYRHVLAYDDAPDELKPAVLAVAKVEHAAREARKS
ncbi:Bacteriophage phi 1.45 protein-like protein [Novosphingobium sp. KN65.2]|nr:Bacteriophage phi 1.45 protein-like protein [Novosphingobium sp. KN65.2]